MKKQALGMGVWITTNAFHDKQKHLYTSIFIVTDFYLI